MEICIEIIVDLRVSKLATFEEAKLSIEIVSQNISMLCS